MTNNINFQDYAKDIKLNLGSVLKADPESSLKENQILITALASAYAVKNKNLVNYILDLARDKISNQEIEAAKAAASIMAMNNIYYRFAHLSEDKEYLKMPAKLRMNIMNNHGIAKIDFEFMSLAVSAINGCGLCISSHVKIIEKEGVDRKTIQHIAKIAAVINAVAQADFIA